MDFADWLQNELHKRKWNHTELARRSGVAQAQISRVVTGKQGAGPDLCIAIAKGLELPRSEVFLARGWLVSYPDDPYGPDIDPRAEKLAKEISTLPKESRDMTLKAVEAVVETARHLTSRIPDFTQPMTGD